MAETRRIIYPNDSGGIDVLIPSEEMSFEDVCKKDVPAGKPYIIVEANELPDGYFRKAWQADFSSPDGTGIGADAYWKSL
ncbi:MAG: hypothetical protein Unbinned1007contig1000_22 [Prokaryotic dsDNA virus sp.]|nr:MAG: hypothetical protein Unbinned1007contig1000_22 [Prokaryotic dsDNA virus sp.]|tara:strand:+ start:15165 stop:15404 length:240 start_codon:yes stop_codon:yes gene_type:complete